MSEVGKLQLGQLTRLRKLSLGAADDGILRQLTRMTSLTDLDLSNSPAVTDAGMVHVGKIQALKTLSLEGAHVSDSGMAEIAILPSLEELQIS
jgi:hypothetical protein